MAEATVVYNEGHPGYYDELRRNAANVTRALFSNLDVVVVANEDANSGSNMTASYTEFLHCHIPYFSIFSRLTPKTDEEDDGLPSVLNTRIPVNSKGPNEGAAAIHLAMTHLNTGNGTIIPQVEGLNERCPIRFTFEIQDTEASETTSVYKVMEVLDRAVAPELDQDGPPPCAFLGAQRSAVTIPMAMLTGVSNYPQMSGLSTSSQLDNRELYRYFSRLIASDDGTAIAFILYFRDVVKTSHVAVLHANTAYGITFLASLASAATEFFPEMKL